MISTPNDILKNRKIHDFFMQLKITKQKILMLDYDGTLAPFRKNRKAAIPYKGIKEILTELISSQHTRIVIISGRWTKDLIPLLDLKQLPEIWGSHGLERRKINGEYSIMEMDEKSLQGLAEADVYVDRKGFSNYCEEKPGCLAIHWRGLRFQIIEDIQKKVIPKWRAIAKEKNLILKKFDGGIELRVYGMNKGLAVKAILSETSEDFQAAYLGDDLTDEDAFMALKGYGLGILVRKNFRTTAADVWLQPPDQLMQFLKQWNETLRLK
jgi:trehalose-phosphatase